VWRRGDTVVVAITVVVASPSTVIAPVCPLPECNSQRYENVPASSKRRSKNPPGATMRSPFDVDV
jgi:hypothetical protein